MPLIINPGHKHIGPGAAIILHNVVSLDVIYISLADFHRCSDRLGLVGVIYEIPGQLPSNVRCGCRWPKVIGWWVCMLTECGLVTPCVSVNTSSGNGFVPDGTKSLPEPVLTYHQWASETLSPKNFSWDLADHLYNDVTCSPIQIWLSCCFYVPNAVRVRYQTQLKLRGRCATKCCSPKSLNCWVPATNLLPTCYTSAEDWGLSELNDVSIISFSVPERINSSIHKLHNMFLLRRTSMHTDSWYSHWSGIQYARASCEDAGAIAARGSSRWIALNLFSATERFLCTSDSGGRWSISRSTMQCNLVTKHSIEELHTLGLGSSLVISSSENDKRRYY